MFIKLIRVFLAIFCLVLGNTGLSQINFNVAYIKNQDKGFRKNQSPFSITNSQYSVRLNDISIYAVRHFIKNFENNPDATWYKTESGLVAHFIKDSIKTHVFYSINGNFQSCIHYYFENKLPQDIRSVVKINFKDFRIYTVAEIYNEEKDIYIIKIENEKIWYTLRIINDSFEIIDSIKKPR